MPENISLTAVAWAASLSVRLLFTDQLAAGVLTKTAAIGCFAALEA